MRVIAACLSAHALRVSVQEYFEHLKISKALSITVSTFYPTDLD
jgi:hypothetical protein